MKNFNFISFLGVIFLSFSCSQLNWSKEPEVLTAEYQLKSFQENERGFDVFILLNQFEPNYKIKSIVLKNKRFDNIKIHQLKKSQVFVQDVLIIESSLIQNFTPPPTDNRKDGILFETEDREIFKEINFKLK